MKGAQIAGTEPGSACRVPVIALGKRSQPLRALYRRGWTHYYTSESDSDLTEDMIKVEAYLYWVLSYDLLEDQCEDTNNWSSHAACRTYGATGSGSRMKQVGHHYFQTSGYVDSQLESSHEWTN
jgi:hypothetical protein